MRTQRRARLQSALEDRLTHIVALVNSKKEHIPPVVSQATVTYPFDITIAGCEHSHSGPMSQNVLDPLFAHAPPVPRVLSVLHPWSDVEDSACRLLFTSALQT